MSNTPETSGEKHPNGSEQKSEFEIPKECKAGVCHNEGPNYELKVEMVPVPEPKPDEILIKLNATGICMSDVHWLLNDLAPVPMSTSVQRSSELTRADWNRLLWRPLSRT
jgi:hypothetical protein